MSFGGKPQVPTKSPTPAGMQANDFSSHEEAVAMRWFIGEDWCPVDWVISEALNIVTKTTTQKAGKGASTTTYEHFVDVAGVTGIGMVDAVTGFEVDGEIVWSGLIQRPTNPAHPDYFHATISCDAFELAHIYWGRPDQPVDALVLGPLGEQNPSLAHPAYRWQPVVSVKKLKCGSSSTVSNLRVRLRRSPKPAVGNFAASGSDQGESIVAGVLELGMDPIYGAGLSADHVVVSEWEALSAAVAEGIGHLSPYLDRARPFKDVAKDFFLYYDGFCRLENGKLRPGWHPHNGTTPAGIPTIDMHAFVQKPNWEVATPADTVNDVICIFRDRSEKWKRRPAYGSDAANIRARRAIQPVTVEMLGFLDGGQASRWATEASTTASEGLAEGDGQLRPSKGRRADGSLILPGDNFVFDDASLQISQVVRLRKRVDPFRGPLTFEFESERGVYPSPYVPPVDLRPRPGKVIPNSVSRARIWEVPKQVSINQRSRNPIVVLAQRPSATAQAPFSNLKAKNVLGFKLWISADNASYDPLRSIESWGSYGTLREALPAASETCVVKVAFDAAAIDLDRIVSQSVEAASNDTLIVVIGGEVFSVGAITLSGLNYDLTCMRQRLGTIATVHAHSSPVWVVWRDELEVIDSLGPKQLTTRYFKLQTYTAQVITDLSDTPSIAHAFVDRKPARPVGLAASSGPGLIVSLKWENGEGSNTSEYQIWKSSTNNLGEAAQVAEIRANRFLDTLDLPDGATRWYWVRAIDEDEEESEFSEPVSATVHAAVGPQGPQGDRGLPGANGSSSYFHIAYADSSDGTVNFNQVGGVYVGTYVDQNPADSSDPAHYTWSQFRGAQGPAGNQGIPGTNGANGQTSYLHIKYSADGGATFTPNSGEDVGAWMGTYVDYSVADSDNPAAYTWARVNGYRDQTPPSNPGAPSIDTGGTYTDHTGKVQSFVVVNIPALPAGAIYQNLLYRQKRDGATGWIVADQIAGAAATKSQIDDLTPGIAYEYALQAFAVGTTSAVVPGVAPGWFFAAKKGALPAPPTGFSVYTPAQKPLPLKINVNNLPAFGATLEWESSVDGDVVEYYFWFKLFLGQTIIKSAPHARVRGNSYQWYDSGFYQQAYVFVASKNSSGEIGDPVDLGFSMASYWGASGGTMAGQNSNSIQSTGFALGGGASTAKFLADDRNSFVWNTTAGASTFSIPISGRGFGNRPDSGWANLSSWSAGYEWVDASYNFDLSTSSNAVFNVKREDRLPIAGGGVYRFSYGVTEND